jgi:tRNA dimethylallyltransferase
VNRYRLFSIIGPTASGKSALAMALARRIGAEILSVDSMQLYRGMDIGTAKPTADEQREIKHHLIDVAEPTEEFAVARFVQLADEVIDDAKRRDVPLIAAGGTPLYFKSLFQGLFEGPAGDDALRERLSQESPQVLHDRLVQVDPPTAQRLHVNDVRRVIRALEVFELTGQPISSFQTQWSSAPRHDATWLGMNCDKELLGQRINARVKLMMEAGWLDEVRTLLNKYERLSKTAGEATGYTQLASHLQGELSIEQAVEETKVQTRQLARRQMKWFRRFENVNWINTTSDVEWVAKSWVMFEGA